MSASKKQGAAKERTYSVVEAAEKLAGEGGLESWGVEGGWLVREYRTGGWSHTLMVLNAIGYVAEAGWHHPDLEVGWSRVKVKLMTHSAKGLTDKDFELAGKIEEVVTWLPGSGSALGGYAAGVNKEWTR